MRDYTFIGTEVLNKYFMENKVGLFIYEAIGSLALDLLIIIYLTLWWVNWHTFRLFPAYIVFYAIRGYIQNKFFMGRPEGYLWEDNNFPSLVVVYHDISDFYYSGHIGSTVIIFHESYAQGWKKGFYVTVFVCCFEWVFLTIIRGHYVIDLVMGCIFARIMHMLSETSIICWICDVKICGYPL